ncbi:hypothetical protein BDQ17DRAFT_1500479 [Cyathus striatus]|nr:hypothetical protein BDQ17DRAFT_1500479 [Cyathus striatus]
MRGDLLRVHIVAQCAILLVGSCTLDIRGGGMIVMEGSKRSDDAGWCRRRTGEEFNYVNNHTLGSTGPYHYSLPPLPLMSPPPHTWKKQLTKNGACTDGLPLRSGFASSFDLRKFALSWLKLSTVGSGTFGECTIARRLCPHTGSVHSLAASSEESTSPSMTAHFSYGLSFVSCLNFPSSPPRAHQRALFNASHKPYYSNISPQPSWSDPKKIVQASIRGGTSGVRRSSITVMKAHLKMKMGKSDERGDLVVDGNMVMKSCLLRRRMGV